jgi:hypothetical protein
LSDPLPYSHFLFLISYFVNPFAKWLQKLYGSHSNFFPVNFSTFTVKIFSLFFHTTIYVVSGGCYRFVFGLYANNFHLFYIQRKMKIWENFIKDKPNL